MSMSDCPQFESWKNKPDTQIPHPLPEGMSAEDVKSSTMESGLPAPPLNLIHKIADEWRTDRKGRTIIGFWIGGLTLATIWGLYIRRREKQILHSIAQKAKETDDDDEAESQSEAKSKSESNLNSKASFKSVLALAIPSRLSSPVLWSSLISLALVWKTQRVSNVNDSIGRMGELIVAQKWDSLADSTMDFAIATVAAAFGIATVDHLKRNLQLSLRHNLVTSIQTKYGSDRRRSKGVDSAGVGVGGGEGAHLLHVLRSISDADSRITRDAEQWCSIAAECWTDICKPIIDVTVYSAKLSNRIGMSSFAQCIVYFVASGMWARSALPSVALTNARIASKEAAFAANHRRLVDYAEEIYFLKGIPTEMNLLNDAYTDLYGVLQTMSRYNYGYQFFHNYVVRYLGTLASFFCLLPMVSRSDHPTEFLLNNLHDLVNIGLAFRDLLKTSKDFQSLLGVSGRIVELDTRLDLELNRLQTAFKGSQSSLNSIRFYDEIDAPFKRNDVDDEKELSPSKSKSESVIRYAILFRNVTIYTPDRSQLLIQNLDLQINLNENLMICGPNGAGKSSLLRVLSGLWQIDSGSIRIAPQLRSQSSIFCLPQRPYLIPKLSIRQQLLYPNINTTNDTQSIVTRDGDSDDADNAQISDDDTPDLSPMKRLQTTFKDAIASLTDERIIEILNCCDLGRLPLNHSLDEAMSDSFWVRLSPGEQQLLGLCRVLLRQPKIAILDESCSAVSEDKKYWFYETCQSLGITVITVAHDSTLKKYHRKILTLDTDKNGKWTLT